jgi:hypothetical protein
MLMITFLIQVTTFPPGPGFAHGRSLFGAPRMTTPIRPP